MTTTTEKQGHLGDIHQKTLPELLELLDRQEKLLKKEKFLFTLPDKGVKVKRFAETLRTLIAERQDQETKSHNNALRLSEREAQTQTESRSASLFKTAKKNNGQQPAIVLTDRSIAAPPRDVVELRGDNPSEKDVSDSLSECLERIKLSSDQTEVRDDSKYINSYERVVKMANENPTETRVFKPNSTLKISKVQDLPDAYKFRSAQTRTEANADSKSETEFLDHSGDRAQVENRNTNVPVAKVSEESAVCIPDYKYDRCVLISVEESVKLVEEQRKKHEELQTRQAAERLASRLHIRLDDYNPEGTNMNYRVSAPDSDSDDEPEIEGYED